MKVVHNQGKQALKRIRERLGLSVCREPLPIGLTVKTVGGIVNSETVNKNPKLWERHCVELSK